MSTPKRITAYPDWMLALARSFEAPEFKREVVLEFPDPAAALRARNSIRGFITALEIAGMLNDYPNFQTARLVLDGVRLHIMHVDVYLPQPKGM